MIISQRSPYLFAPIISIEPISIIDSPGGTTTVTHSGMTFVRSDVVDYHNEYQLYGLNFDNLEVSYSSEGVTLSSNHVLSRNTGTDGRITVRFSNERAETKNFFFDFSDVAGGVSYSNPKTLIPGSYAKYSFDRVSAIFDVLDDGTPDNHRVFETDYTRRHVSVIPHASLTGQVVNQYFGGQKRFIAITPRHVLGCGHYGQHPIGYTSRFLDLSGVLHTRTTVAAWNGLYDGNKPFRQDVEVWLLNEDLPESITPTPVVGSWYYNLVGTKLNYTTFANAFGITSFNQDMHICPVQFHETSPYTVPDTRLDTIGGVALSGYDFGAGLDRKIFNLEGYDTWEYSIHTNPFYHNVRNGDSGSPILMPVDGGWALAAIYSSGFWQENGLNALIKAVDTKYGIDTGYTVTVAPNPIA